METSILAFITIYDKTDDFEDGIFVLNLLTSSYERTYVHQTAGNPLQHKFKT